MQRTSACILFALVAASCASAAPAANEVESPRWLEEISTASATTHVPATDASPGPAAGTVAPARLAPPVEPDSAASEPAAPSATSPVADASHVHGHGHYHGEERLEPLTHSPPADASDPVAVASYVAQVWFSRSPQSPPAHEVLDRWAASEFLDGRRPGDGAPNSAAIVRADVAESLAVVNAATASVTITMEQATEIAGRLEVRVMVVIATVVEIETGWQVAWLEVA